MKLLNIVKSPKPEKKWRATFQKIDGKLKHTDFGATGYQDLTQHKDEARAANYRRRHLKDLLTNDPTRAGYLSYYLLWTTSDFDANVRYYKRRFNM